MAEDKHMRAIQEATEEAIRKGHRLGAGKSNQVNVFFVGRCLRCRGSFVVNGTRMTGDLLDIVCPGPDQI